MTVQTSPAADRVRPYLPDDRFPRLSLLAGPTPLVRLPAFSREVGIEVWMKRDDTGSIALAGNKIRKIEFTLGRAIRDGATAVVCVGPQQSNSVRATAAASAVLGLRCVALLEGDAPDHAEGNLLIDRLVGADVRFSGSHDWDVVEAAAKAIARDLEAAGERVVVLPMGGSVPLGSLGFLTAYAELLDQAAAAGVNPTAIVHASSTGGTHAGLELGCRLLGGPRVQGMGVAKGPIDLAVKVADLATEAAALIGAPERWTASDVALDMRYMGEAYAIPTDAGLEAIRLLARTEAILTDPVYSGKALAGLIDHARTGRLAGPVVFWHTGGAVAMLAGALSAIVDPERLAGPAA